MGLDGSLGLTSKSRAVEGSKERGAGEGVARRENQLGQRQRDVPNLRTC